MLVIFNNFTLLSTSPIIVFYFFSFFFFLFFFETELYLHVMSICHIFKEALVKILSNLPHEKVTILQVYLTFTWFL